MLDVGGQDASEAFEDVGHSDEARDILNGLLVGDLKRGVSSFSSRSHPHNPSSFSSSPTIANTNDFEIRQTTPRVNPTMKPPRPVADQTRTRAVLLAGSDSAPMRSCLLVRDWLSLDINMCSSSRLRSRWGDKQQMIGETV